MPRPGQAIVTLDGRDFYLGPHGTQTSKREYDRLVGEWQANGRRLPVEPGTVVTVTELCAAYWRFCKTYYVKKKSFVATTNKVRVVPSIA